MYTCNIKATSEIEFLYICFCGIVLLGLIPDYSNKSISQTEMKEHNRQSGNGRKTFPAPKSMNWKVFPSKSLWKGTWKENPSNINCLFLEGISFEDILEGNSFHLKDKQVGRKILPRFVVHLEGYSILLQ